MKASVERLRWGLAGAAVLLLVVLAGFLSYGRYSALKKWKRTVARLGAHIAHETDGFTYSQSQKGRTDFTVHASKAIQHGDGKWTLHDVVVTLYSKTNTDQDHIYSSDIQYDEKTGVATAVGEVHMDLQAPGALAKSEKQDEGKAPAQETNADDAEGDRVIHVRTSGLVYVRKLSVAATDQPVEFRYEGMECTAKGAEFDSGESFLHLLADVVMTGNVRNAPMTVHAVKADLNRQNNTIVLDHPVGESQGRTVTAANALMYLRHDGSLQQAEGSGGVTMVAGTRRVSAAGFEGSFGATSLPQATKLTGGVTVTDSDAKRPLRGQAKEVDTSFDAAGNPMSVLGTGGARVAFTDHGAGHPDLAREMHGDRVLATLTAVSLAGKRKEVSRLSEIHAMGSAMARGESVVSVAGAQGVKTAELKSTQVSGDDLRALFDAGVEGSELRHVLGTGHTRLQQDAPQGEQQTSSGETLDVRFAQGTAGGSKAGSSGGRLEIATATQEGHVAIHSVPAMGAGATAKEAPADGSAARAVYEGATSRLTLSGGAMFTQGTTTLTAATIGVDQKTGDAEAVGSVTATMVGSAAGGKEQGKVEQATHVTSDRATLARGSGLARFFGSDAGPARLWQGASEVEAATLLMDQKRRSLTARPAAKGGLVHAVFADAGASSAKDKGAGQVVRVVSPAMDYDDLNREATFSGGVAVDGTEGQARSQRGVVFLNPVAEKPGSEGPDPGHPGVRGGQPTPFGGSVRRIVLLGDVRIDQPGRTGTGEELVYTSADSMFVFTGTPAKPPHMVDAQQGSVTGATLMFHSVKGGVGDSTIVVAGTPPGPAQEKHGRVRTETQVKQR